MSTPSPLANTNLAQAEDLPRASMSRLAPASVGQWFFRASFGAARLWTAGEICHMVVDYAGTRRCSCGASGHLEAYTSGPAMAQRYRELSGTRLAPDLKAVAVLAHHGDTHAVRAIAEGAQILGASLAGLLNVFDPEVLVIGGGVPEMGELWWQHFEAALRANPMPGPARH